ncbi:hypothetical protein A6E04_01695 [Aliivibrio logei]|uniref:Glycosyltransferase 2-like domain-containing protein n=2 Tax=Aliivibrio logei TaxID=688 RepID=A0A1B9NVE2_ALILO|nr:hypothetical protein A6E04_01695 [Aliivibrio logei]
MPAYNCGRFIEESINSVIYQTHQKWELIIVDDCSSDNTANLVERYKDERIKYFCLPENSGSPSEPRNVGLKHAHGDYIAFLDSDDLWHEEKLEKQLDFMQRNNFKFSCTAYSIVDSKGNLKSSYTPPSRVDYAQLLTNNSIGCLTVILHQDLIDGMFFPNCGHEDFALWLKILRKSNVVHSLNTKLATYRRMENSVSSNKKKLILFFWNIYRNEEKIGLFKTIYLCFRYFVNVMWFKYK